ncbi:GspE/PulE family protein [Salisediminibacterium selenitireducens]|uniref:Type II secretion system protein E n=1 Tax=Bacillus selenitireducens (strain ATCC 700615 / DSM 15326 / MLS10) TaxID=439292 RepID=D6XT15_BACIE|nr:GspE/PulE family protein [Salisediminibacterium selenitireducens]ADH98951.1 type II secretion system protein E [[Bacillus] selenitireducens MLS10]
MAKQRKRIGDLLVEAGLLTEQQVQDVLKVKGSEKLGDALISRDYITENQLIEVLEFQLGIPHVHINQQPVDESVIRLIPRDFAARNEVFPIQKKNNQLQVAMSDPMDYVTLEDIRMSTGFEVDPVISGRREIQQAIERYYDDQDGDLDLDIEDQEDDTIISANVDAENEDDAPIIRLVNKVLVKAVAKGASDVHIDPQEKKVIVRYRVDGVLMTDRAVPKSDHNAVVARIKIMANLNITETRLPQGGRVKVSIEGRPVDLRIATLATVFGEKIVIRILDMDNAVKDVSEIDLNKINLDKFRRLIKRPSGMVLITGPTGSGKTTTLYAAMTALNTPDVNLITIEDPVEYQVKGINQVQVNAPIGLTFARGLRSILRQDPNIVMIGEIRDKETAEIAIRASLTGHLVFSTIHTNSAIGTIPRLIDMGIEPFLVMSSLSGIVSQRLVRKVCAECGEDYEPTENERAMFDKRGIPLTRLRRGKGCPICNETGYKGRMAIHEVLEIDDKIRRMVMNNQPMEDVRLYAMEHDMIFLLEDGLLKVKQGKTSLEELYRVAMDD